VCADSRMCQCPLFPGGRWIVVVAVMLVVLAVVFSLCMCRCGRGWREGMCVSMGETKERAHAEIVWRTPCRRNTPSMLLSPVPPPQCC
jgi:hypothetical protein